VHPTTAPIPDILLLQPVLPERHGSRVGTNGVRKVTYHDPDGNEFGFGGAAQ
jgi:hypothetical protein